MPVAAPHPACQPKMFPKGQSHPELKATDTNHPVSISVCFATRANTVSDLRAISSSMTPKAFFIVRYQSLRMTNSTVSSSDVLNKLGLWWMSQKQFAISYFSNFYLEG